MYDTTRPSAGHRPSQQADRPIWEALSQTSGPPEPGFERPARTGALDPPESIARGPTSRTRQKLDAVRVRYEGSSVAALARQLKALDFASWATVFGAELLWSTLPLLILLGSLANRRIDGDLSRHIGLNSQGARIVGGLFQGASHHPVLAIVTGLLFSLAGTFAVVASLETMYENVFDLKHRGLRDLPRQLVWIAVLIGLLIADAAGDRSARAAVGPVVEAIVTFAVVAVFFAWTMHFLLAGRVPWRSVVRPALVTAVLWIVLGLISSFYFSGEVVDDSKTFGKIGVVFTFLTWFFLIGTVIVLGAAIGGVWQRRTGSAPAAPPSP
jgi:membrane protein